MIYSREDLRPIPTYPTYPPYHVGDYLEDYFYNKFVEKKLTLTRDYIGISWTTLYCQNQDQQIQSFLNSLDPSKKYFTVCQHDDAPRHILPPDTICFSAGGNVNGPNIKPIPLICSPIPIKPIENKKQYLASFVGSFTHPIRARMAHKLQYLSDYKILIKMWNPTVEKSEMDVFFNLASQSKYLLCPRGYGLNSFRLYEAFQLGCVPVIITDKFFLPWTDELNWNDFSVLIDESKIDHIDDVLKNINEDQYHKMVTIGKNLYPKYFTLDALVENITKRLL